MQPLIVATGNKGKTKEINNIVAELGFEVRSLLDVDNVPHIVEDQETFEGNAVKKAVAVYKAFQTATLADDSGLVVDALNGQPGVHSARYGGMGLNDTQRYKKLLEALQDVPTENRTARFECAMAFIRPGDDKSPHIFKGTIEGNIAFAPKGQNGFGYDPIFIPNGKNESMAQLNAAEKKEISHRGQALKSFAKWLLAHS